MTRPPATLSAVRISDGRAYVPRSFLFLVLDAQNPAVSPARFALEGLTHVQLGRGDGRAARAGEQLRVVVADPYVSTRHATMRREGARWLLDDISKNGTAVNGAAVRTHALADGDLVELGHVFLRFRSGMEATHEDLGDWYAADHPALDGLTTLLPPLQQTLRELERIARSAISVVLRGETGTGKEVLARALHALSGRAGPFVAVNCGAIAANLVESELFGYRRGAFSGAVEDRPGIIRSADGGTLLLDEIGDLPLPAQAALLRVLQEREVLPVGGTRAVPVDVRVLSASHLDLARRVADQRFRADLEARLAGLTLDVPPLRERREDLGLLVAALLRRHAPGGATLERDAARALLRYPWPKNVRELEQALAAAVVLAGKAPIALKHLPPALRKPLPTAPQRAVADDEDDVKKELVAHLEAEDGNVSAVARAMGKTRKQIQRWMKRYELDPETYRRT